MANYIKYKISSGEIFATGSSSDDHVPFPEEDGFSIIQGYGSYFTHYVNNNEIVAYTSEQMDAKMQKPLFPAEWSNVTFSWVAN